MKLLFTMEHGIWSNLNLCSQTMVIQCSWRINQPLFNLRLELWSVLTHLFQQTTIRLVKTINTPTVTSKA